MKNAYIVAPYRSAVGKAFRGTLRSKRPDDLCADVIKGVLEKAGDFDRSLIEDTIVGCAMPEAEQGMNVARIAALLADLPDVVAGVTVNRFCSSGLQTIAMAAHQIQAGAGDCILAGGTESMTMVPMMGHKPVGSRAIMSGQDKRQEYYLGMGHTAENVAKDYKVTRDDQDEFAYQSNMKASKAIADGLFKDEIVPVPVEIRRPGKDGVPQVDTVTFDTDEGPRPETTTEALGKLRPAFLAGGTVTAGNASQMSDGAGMCLVVSEEFLKTHNLTPAARFLGFSVAGVPPRVMGIGPIEAIPRALKQAKLTIKDIERFELNEAFASQALAVIRTLDINPEIVNPTGGAIALGHPLGATGAKLTATLIHGMKRDKQKYGIVTMCIGNGMGAAGVFENLS
ncbi:acetyl-CoA C-acyltransferase [Pseudobacteriovorax antillogorgiicola]|uniref:acetyl-CoA C-acyltransferase n=1 Tax=Pseudobacteriovorax antillogorgiicola TaxID=1513793 RepID=A0A1Y6BE43_9BACT|nr:acetyl-CoA C-acyltransferase [Pseudobacteriovorax antillogorgiicola]TCS58608.1 acetyl-CoA acyltransferase [Pseudobacteriovorax antillogorgiicola]SME96890.1 acetyl-CoA acyltransferase [Pseudobacteriovorax antillogorgiicola]